MQKKKCYRLKHEVKAEQHNTKQMRDGYHPVTRIDSKNLINAAEEEKQHEDAANQQDDWPIAKIICTTAFEIIIRPKQSQYQRSIQANGK